MKNLKFSNKDCMATCAPSDSSYKFPLQKPMWCPLCGAYQDGIIASRYIHSGPGNTQIGTVGYKCTHCDQHYLVIYNIDKAQKTASFAEMYPSVNVDYRNDILESVSPRFIFFYNQALRSEERGDIELAAIGYRSALEYLIKDFAINELKVDYKEVVNVKLCDAITKYLGEKDLTATADVVRILGNDYTHYKRKYPEYDFELLKRYMEIFIKLVETKVMIANPPVKRKDRTPPAFLPPSSSTL